MKKIAILLGLCILFSSRKIESNGVFFTWYNTELTIPLGESLEPFLNIPYAKLNDPNLDPNIYYEKNGVNYTYQSIIQTSVVKTYRLDFRVHSPKYNVSSTQTITIRVVDNIPPVFDKVPLITVPVFSKTVDYTLGLQYHDNYSEITNMVLIIDSNAVNLNQIGVYPIMYTLYDEFDNETKIQSSVLVKDYYAPMITQTKPLIIEPNQSWVISDYFIVKDNYDTVVNTIIDDSLVDYNTLGTYPLSLVSYDMSGNHYGIETTIEIKDLTPPELSLSTTKLTLHLGDSFDLSSVILKVKDNYSYLTLDDVQITTDLNISKVGFYEAIYEVNDEFGLKTALRIPIYVVYKEKPMITYNPLVVKIGEAIDFKSGITQVSTIPLEITVFDTNMQPNPGSYEIVYVVKDVYGNHQVFHRALIIEGSSDEKSMMPYLISGGILLGVSILALWIWKKRHP